MILNVTNASGKTKIETVPSVSSFLTYNGKEQSPTWLAYDPEQLTMTGTMSATNAGTYTVAFTPTKKYKWADGYEGAKFVEWTIAKAPGTLSLSTSSSTIIGKNKTATFTVTRTGDGKISVSSSNTSIATASVSGTTVTVTSKGYGSAAITVSIADGTNHKAPSSKTCSVKVDYQYLYKDGEKFTDVTGNLTFRGNEDCSLSQGSSSFKLSIWNGDWGTEAVSGVAYFATSIDLTNFDKLVFKGSFSRGSNDWNGIGVWSSSTTPGWTNCAAKSSSISSGKSTIDISTLDGKYYCGVWGYYNGTSVTCTSLWLE